MGEEEAAAAAEEEAEEEEKEKEEEEEKIKIKEKSVMQKESFLPRTLRLRYQNVRLAWYVSQLKLAPTLLAGPCMAPVIFCTPQQCHFDSNTARPSTNNQSIKQSI